jgi:hypothetical protein
MFFKTRGRFSVISISSQGFALRWELTEKSPLVLKKHHSSRVPVKCETKSKQNETKRNETK